MATSKKSTQRLDGEAHNRLTTSAQESSSSANSSLSSMFLDRNRKLDSAAENRSSTSCDAIENKERKIDLSGIEGEQSDKRDLASCSSTKKSLCEVCGSEWSQEEATDFACYTCYEFYWRSKELRKLYYCQFSGTCMLDNTKIKNCEYCRAKKHLGLDKKLNKEQLKKLESEPFDLSMVQTLRIKYQQKEVERLADYEFLLTISHSHYTN
ncbi:hypothetical protein B4U79_17959, partial [Dinothrombium tinctorium]